MLFSLFEAKIRHAKKAKRRAMRKKNRLDAMRKDKKKNPKKRHVKKRNNAMRKDELRHAILYDLVDSK